MRTQYGKVASILILNDADKDVISENNGVYFFMLSRISRATISPLKQSITGEAYSLPSTPSTVRQLKEKGVEVYFEKENILTLDSKGELLITIMSSLAQEESRFISENVTWGQRKRMADGKVRVIINAENEMIFRFKDGAELPWTI